MTETLSELCARYVSMKQALGYRFTSVVPMLRSFVRFAEHRNETFIRCETVLAWLGDPARTKPVTRALNLRAVRNFAIWAHIRDPRHEVPPDMPDTFRYRRPAPHLMSVEDIERVLALALELPPADTISPLTWHYLFGLIATTGMRISEALSLTFDDIQPDGLVIRDSKFGKSRLIVLHSSTVAAMNRYLEVRCRLKTADRHLFVLATGKPPYRTYPTEVFRKLAEQAGLREIDSPRGPTPHSLRHSFAVRSLEQLNPDSDSSRHMLALATYLGHAKVSSTYWYLEATPTLLHDIAQATESAHAAYCGGVS